MEIISRLAEGVTNNPQKERGWAHVTQVGNAIRPIFACATVDFEKFCYCTPLTAINNAVDDGPLLLTPTALDANDSRCTLQCASTNDAIGLGLYAKTQAPSVRFTVHL